MQLILLLCFYFMLETVIGQEVTNGFSEDTTEPPGWTRTQQVDWDTLSTVGFQESNQRDQPQGGRTEQSPGLTHQWRQMLVHYPPYGERLPQNQQQQFLESPTIVLQQPEADPMNSTTSAHFRPQPVQNPVNPPLNYPFFYYPSVLPPEPSAIRSQIFPPSQELYNYSVPFARSSNVFESAFGENTQRLPVRPSSNFPFPYYFPQSVSIRDAENVIASDAYPASNLYYPPYQSISNGENAEIPINIYVRPPYTDSEASSVAQSESTAPRRVQRPEIEQSESQRKIAPIENPVLPESFPLEPLPPQAVAYGDLPFPLSYFPPGIVPPVPVPASPFLPGIVPIAQPQRTPQSVAAPGQQSPPTPTPEETRPVHAPSPNLPSAETLPPTAREVSPPPLNIEEQGLPEVKSPYEFGFDMNDGHGSGQSRQEVSNGDGVVKGRYSYTDPFGMYRVVNYIADHNGFRAFVQSNEPGVANPGSADVVVIAEPPPPHALAEGVRKPDLIPIVVPDETADLLAEGTVLKEELSKP